ncbi:MAG TPA: peptidoglycan-binding protein, partial [Methylomirabilota bacterium]|nr:peptidoglycan-binding protein [Methylomirabilota bacterium]
KSLAEWQALGVVRAGGGAFPRPGDSGQLWIPAGTGAPAFLTLHNFNVIKRYNNANAYALGVGHLGDRLGGGGAFVGSWPRLYEPLWAEADRMELQRRLSSLGYPVGDIDGKIGTATLAAVRSYQANRGLPVDGYPSQDLLKRLKGGG